MESKKKLVINCAVCDMRNMTEEKLESYESVTINSAHIILSPKVSELLARYRVDMNAMEIVEIPREVKLVTVNGKYKISGKEQPDGFTCLIANGKVEVEPDAAEALKKYVKIIINGKIVYPDSLSGYLTQLKVNGKAETYPADAIRMNPVGIVNKVFILRAKEGKYYAGRMVLLSDEQLDVGLLLQKNVEFLTPKAFIASSLLEKAIPLFADEVEIEEIPDGCTFIDDSVKLTAGLIRRKGNRLFVDGCVTIEEDGRGALEALEYLRVDDEVRIAESLAGLFETSDFICEELHVIKGFTVSDKVSFTVDRRLVERYPDGINISDCAVLKIAEDITADEIEKLLDISDCAVVTCSPGQVSALEKVCEDVAKIDCSDKKEASIELLLGSASEGTASVINCADYVF